MNGLGRSGLAGRAGMAVFLLVWVLAGDAAAMGGSEEDNPGGGADRELCGVLRVVGNEPMTSLILESREGDVYAVSPESAEGVESLPRRAFCFTVQELEGEPPPPGVNCEGVVRIIRWTPADSKP